MADEGKEKPAPPTLPEELEANLEEAVERSYGKKIVASLRKPEEKGEIN